MEEIQLTDVLKDIVDSFENAFKREIVFESNETVTILTDQNKFKQLMFIFLDNARKYSEEAITVLITDSQNEVRIDISDQGIGIPKEDLSKVFDRFYRVDQARSRKIGGYGLGLSLAKELADALNTKIDIQSLEGIGTTVTLIFRKNFKNR